MHLLGIKNYSLAISVPTYDWGFEITGAPFMSSYVPGESYTKILARSP